MKNYKANFNFFDKIDTPQKAYWLGFIWADGYIAKRNRSLPNGKMRVEYNLKLAIKDSDSGHVQKFLDDIESDYPVHYYKTSGFNDYEIFEARAFITNLHMCSKLYEEYGIIPRRYDATNVISVIPEKLYRYFILGLFDADGSFTCYSGHYGDKMNVSFGGSEQLLRFIESTLVGQGVIDKAKTESGVRSLITRHKGKDGTWRTIAFPGIPQASKILNWLYKDSVIHLDRKYEKYLSVPYLREDRISCWVKRKEKIKK